ncbi:MAG: SDR family oxidoreductase [Methylobacteriaceae bacterium]|nr:SDR family oxidoreductase [Methylobacteriaceae bacterium]
MFDLAGKTILLTGASKGIGAAIAQALGHAGAHLVAHYGSDRAGAEAATAEIAAERKHLLKADFADNADVDALWRIALAWQGRIDVLISNAAIMHWAGGLEGDDDALWDRVWAETLQVNVIAPARLMRHAIRHFREARGGILITLSSWAAQRGVSNPDAVAYAASKAAIKAAAQTIARGYARENILSYVVAPGVVHTRMSEEAATTQGGVAAVNAGLAMGEWAPPEDIANLVAFLSSGASRHLTGATLDVNGASYVR